MISSLTMLFEIVAPYPNLLHSLSPFSTLFVSLELITILNTIYYWFIGLSSLPQSTSQQLELNSRLGTWFLFCSLMNALYLIKPLNIIVFNKYLLNNHSKCFKFTLKILTLLHLFFSIKKKSQLSQKKRKNKAIYNLDLWFP